MDYQCISYPHPYLLIWIECKKYGNSLTGAPSLPEADKGVLDQDAELMLAFEVLDELQKTRDDEESQRKRLRDEASSRLGHQS